MTPPRTRILLPVLAVAALTAVACDGAPAPTPPAGTAESRAIVAVLSADPRFANMSPLSTDAIGQANWYEVGSAGGDLTVTVRAGWGDCFAGCTDEHRWVYRVGADGLPTLVDESGSPVPPGLLPGGDAALPASLIVIAWAAPTCPVERPGDPACAPRPVAGAPIVVSPADGREIAAATATTNAAGEAQLQVPAGIYFVTAGAVEGLMETPPPVPVSLAGGLGGFVSLTYDTGIR